MHHVIYIFFHHAYGHFRKYRNYVNWDCRNIHSFAICSHSATWRMQSNDEGNPCTSVEMIEARSDPVAVFCVWQRTHSATASLCPPTLSAVFFLVLHESVTDVVWKRLHLSPLPNPSEIIQTCFINHGHLILRLSHLWSVLCRIKIHYFFPYRKAFAMTNALLIFSSSDSGLFFFFSVFGTTFYCLANKYVSGLRDVMWDKHFMCHRLDCHLCQRNKVHSFVVRTNRCVIWQTIEVSQTVLFPGGCRW